MSSSVPRAHGSRVRDGVRDDVRDGERDDVAVIAPVAPLRGGIAHHTESLCAALLGAQGHDGQPIRTVSVESYRRLYPRALFPGTSERDDHELPAAFAAIDVHRDLIAWRPSTWRAPLRRLRAPARTVVGVHWHAALAPMLATLLAGARRAAAPAHVVLLAHNATSHERGGAVLDDVVGRVLAHVAHRVVVHAQCDVAAWRARGARSVDVVPHPPYLRFGVSSGQRAQMSSPVERERARARFGVPADAFVCLCFGLIRRYKGLETALAAVARTRAVPLASQSASQSASRSAAQSASRSASRVHLLVVGEPYVPRRELDAWVRASNIGARLTLVPRFVDDDEVTDAFAAADVLLAPYRHASHSGPIMIARARGLPVIAADVGGLKDIVDVATGSELVRGHDPDAWARAIERAIGRAMAHDHASLIASPPASPITWGWDELARAVLRRWSA